MAARRRIAVVTGTRAEYGLLRSTLQAADAHRRINSQLIVTGMHLLKKFGNTLNYIKEDGFKIDARVRMQTGTDSPLAQSRALARGIEGIAAQLRRLRSEIVVVLGDRIEALAGALAGTTVDVVVAHIHGGDVAPGYVDDSIRHAITKLSHVHFAATEDAGKRLRRLGERPQNIHVVGAPGLDDLAKVRRPPAGWLHTVYKLDPAHDVALILQHPIGRSRTLERRTMMNILNAVEKSELCGLILYPNSDPGHQGIIDAIKHKTAGAPGGRWAVARSLPRFEFLQCLKAARLLVGNSSCGIIESASAATPAVNIGPRQQGRLRCSRTVVDVGEHTSRIVAAMTQALNLRLTPPPRSIYGEGKAGRRIASVLAGLRLSDNLRRKQINY